MPERFRGFLRWNAIQISLRPLPLEPIVDAVRRSAAVDGTNLPTSFTATDRQTGTIQISQTIVFNRINFKKFKPVPLNVSLLTVQTLLSVTSRCRLYFPLICNFEIFILIRLVEVVARLNRNINNGVNRGKQTKTDPIIIIFSFYHLW